MRHARNSEADDGIWSDTKSQRALASAVAPRAIPAISFEDLFGEGAEEHARRETVEAMAAGDIQQAAVWEAAAQTLHTLHIINWIWARPRGDLLPRFDPTNARSPDIPG